MTKLDKLIILVMEELANEGINHRRTNENELTASNFNIRIRFSNNADCVYINTADYEFNEAVFYNLKNERGRLISTGAIMNTFFRILSVLAKRQLENVSRETSDTENVPRETPNTPDTENTTEDTENNTEDTTQKPVITPTYTDEEIDNELSKIECRLKELITKELNSYTFNYMQYKAYHIAQAVIAFSVNSKMYTLNFVTEPYSLDGKVTLQDTYTDEILFEKKYLSFDITDYHISICSIFYHLVRKVKRMNEEE